VSILFGTRGIQATSVLEVIYLLLSLAVKEFTQTLYFNIGNSLLMLCINLGGDFCIDRILYCLVQEKFSSHYRTEKV
jgi:hypothetical protein